MSLYKSPQVQHFLKYLRNPKKSNKLNQNGSLKYHLQRIQQRNTEKYAQHSQPYIHIFSPSTFVYYQD